MPLSRESSHGTPPASTGIGAVPWLSPEGWEIPTPFPGCSIPRKLSSLTWRQIPAESALLTCQRPRRGPKTEFSATLGHSGAFFGARIFLPARPIFPALSALCCGEGCRIRKDGKNNEKMSNSIQALPCLLHWGYWRRRRPYRRLCHFQAQPRRHCRWRSDSSSSYRRCCGRGLQEETAGTCRPVKARTGKAPGRGIDTFPLSPKDRSRYTRSPWSR